MLCYVNGLRDCADRRELDPELALDACDSFHAIHLSMAMRAMPPADHELFVARDECAAAGPALLEKFGVFSMLDVISPATLVDLQQAAQARLDEVLKLRSQHRAAGTMGNGVWKELCCRDGDRFDVHFRMSEAPFAALGADGPWCAAVREILGADAKLLYTGQVVACGCDAIDADDESDQEWHMDGGHLDEERYLRCRCVTAFVPLVDLCADSGATEFSLGSHRHECEDLGERVLECPAGLAIRPSSFTIARCIAAIAAPPTAPRPIGRSCTLRTPAGGLRARSTTGMPTSTGRYLRAAKLWRWQRRWATAAPRQTTGQPPRPSFGR